MKAKSGFSACVPSSFTGKKSALSEKAPPRPGKESTHSAKTPTRPGKTRASQPGTLPASGKNLARKKNSAPGKERASQLSSKEMLLECAAAEFLKNGWTKSSMREIAKQAGVTTGSLYFHFKNKAELFDALVKDVYGTLLSNHRSMYETFFAMQPDRKKMRMFRFESRKKTVDFIYRNYRAVKLLVCCSEGTQYADFFQLMMNDTYKADLRAFSMCKDNNIFVHQDIDWRLYSAIDKSFWACLFETVKLDIPYEQALKYVDVLDDFYETGWRKIILTPEDYGSRSYKPS